MRRGIASSHAGRQAKATDGIIGRGIRLNSILQFVKRHPPNIHLAEDSFFSRQLWAMRFKIKKLDPVERLWAVWLACCGVPLGLTLNVVFLEAGPTSGLFRQISNNILSIGTVICLLSWICAGYVVFLIRKRRTSKTRFDHWTVILIWTPFTMLGLFVLSGVLFFVVVMILSLIGLIS